MKLQFHQHYFKMFPCHINFSHFGGNSVPDGDFITCLFKNVMQSSSSRSYKLQKRRSLVCDILICNHKNETVSVLFIFSFNLPKLIRKLNAGVPSTFPERRREFKIAIHSEYEARESLYKHV